MYSDRVTLAHIYCRDDLHASRWGNYLENLTSDEARRIAKAPRKRTLSDFREGPPAEATT